MMNYPNGDHPTIWNTSWSDPDSIDNDHTTPHRQTSHSYSPNENIPQAEEAAETLLQFQTHPTPMKQQDNLTQAITRLASALKTPSSPLEPLPVELPAVHLPERRRAGRVGPDSWQYQVIIKMNEYCVSHEPDLVAVIQDVTERCRKLHLLAKIVKYDHLPGAIFEELVTIIGGPTVLRVFCNSKNFERTPPPPTALEVAVVLGTQLDDSMSIQEMAQRAESMTADERVLFWNEHVVMNRQVTDV